MSSATATWTLPYSWYTDPEVARSEQERLFGRHWQYVARADQLAEPGSFATARVGHLPIVLVRGRDGELRGFVNVCRHRGFVVCEGEGRRETLQCPYHAWTYDLDGSLRNAPRADDEAGFDRSELGLAPVSVAVWGPFVFACPSLAPLPFEEWLGDVPGLLAADGVDVDALVFRFRSEPADYACNWKVAVENFLECYHCQIAHPTLAKTLDVSREGYLLETRRWSSTQFGPPREGGVYDTTGEIERGQFHFLFPSTVINAMPGRLNFSIGPILPRTPQTAHRLLDYWFADDVDETWLEDFMVLDAAVGNEDRVLVERVQQGIASGGLEHGTLMPESELLIAHFQALVADALG